MRRHDLEDERGASVGLDFTIERTDLSARPRLRIEAGASRIVLGVGGSDHAFARIHRAYSGLWLALADHETVMLLPPITADEARALPRQGDPSYLARWTRFFADRLVGANALEEGRYALTAAFDPQLSAKPVASSCEEAPYVVQRAHDLSSTSTMSAVTWKSWWLNGSGRVVRLRRPSLPDAARVKAWRKRAREGALPPVLLFYVSGLDLFVILDGHDRLAAALAEKVPPPLLVAWRVCEEPRYVDREAQAAVVRELSIRREDRRGRRGPLDTDAENAVLRRTFPAATYLYTKSRAWPLRDDAQAWEARVRRAVAAPIDERFFSGERPDQNE